ncbi:MAG: orotate phosphoribosyltransferase, partial [Acutalibacteraceae bacterium]|nr:orotate phosphoribosyltransferase [Acutalibacteraceae bacterium]
SVNRCEVGKPPGKTAFMEVAEEFGIKVHALITVKDIYEYLKEQGTYDSVLKAMKTYMEQYCIFE